MIIAFVRSQRSSLKERPVSARTAHETSCNRIGGRQPGRILRRTLQESNSKFRCCASTNTETSARRWDGFKSCREFIGIAKFRSFPTDSDALRLEQPA